MEEKSKKKFRFNIIDFIVIIVLIAGIAFVGYKLFGNKINSGSTTYLVTYFTEQMPEDSATRIAVGDSVYDDVENVKLGKVTDVQLGDAIVYSSNDAGQIVLSDKDGYNSIYVTAEVPATAFDNGVLIDAVKYSVNHSFTARVGDTKVYLRITDIQVAAAN